MVTESVPPSSDGWRPGGAYGSINPRDRSGYQNDRYAMIFTTEPCAAGLSRAATAADRHIARQNITVPFARAEPLPQLSNHPAGWRTGGWLLHQPDKPPEQGARMGRESYRATGQRRGGGGGAAAAAGAAAASGPAGVGVGSWAGPRRERGAV